MLHVCELCSVCLAEYIRIREEEIAQHEEAQACADALNAEPLGLPLELARWAVNYLRNARLQAEACQEVAQ